MLQTQPSRYKRSEQMNRPLQEQRPLDLALYEPRGLRGLSQAFFYGLDKNDIDIMATCSFSLPGRQIDGRRFLEVAYDLFIFRKFDDVLSMCNVGHGSAEIVFPQILQGATTERLVDRDTTDPKEEDIVTGEYAQSVWRRKFNESVCILAIQAYAETDQWNSVHPFLKQYYESQAKYPLTITKLCILLSTKVRDFSSAESLAVEWLSDASNQTLTQYSSILELLISHVLLPQSKLQEAKALVELNSGLSPEKKMHYLKCLEKIEKEWKARKRTKTDNGSANESPGLALMQLVERLKQLITRLVPVAGLRFVRSIACLSFFIYLIVVRTNLDLSSSVSHASVLWSGIIRIWRSLFSPFHFMPRA